MNTHQADLNAFADGSSFGMVRAISALLAGTVFLFAACFHCRCCAIRFAAPRLRRQSACFVFDNPELATTTASAHCLGIALKESLINLENEHEETRDLQIFTVPACGFIAALNPNWYEWSRRQAHRRKFFDKSRAQLRLRLTRRQTSVRISPYTTGQ